MAEFATITEIPHEFRKTAARVLAVTSAFSFTIVGNQVGLYCGNIVTEHRLPDVLPPDSLEKLQVLFVLSCFAFSGLAAGFLAGVAVNRGLRTFLREYQQEREIEKRPAILPAIEKDNSTTIPPD